MKRLLVAGAGSLFAWSSFAQQQVQKVLTVATDNSQASQAIVTPENLPEVGKHVGGNIDAMSMIVSLFLMLALIIICGLVLKRFQRIRPEGKGLKIVTSMYLGTKERLVVVQVGDKQQLLGVTAQQITLLDTLEQPLPDNAMITAELGQSFSALIQNKLFKKTS